MASVTSAWGPSGATKKTAQIRDHGGDAGVDPTHHHHTLPPPTEEKERLLRRFREGLDTSGTAKHIGASLPRMAPSDDNGCAGRL